jgi:hypothetical protein
MPDPASRTPIRLADIVCRRSDPLSAFGYVMGLILTDPELALVRWRGAETSFVVVDSLVNLIDVLPKIF